LFHRSYYRKYGGLIDRVKKSMLENGVIAEVRESEYDEQGHEKKGAKTPFVILKGNLK
jgi:hypothetical protein